MIFFAVTVIIWIISAIAKSVGKSSKKEQTWTGDEWPEGGALPESAGENRSAEAPFPPAVLPPPVPAAPVPLRQNQQPVTVPAEWHKQTSSHVQTATTYAPQRLPPHVKLQPTRPAVTIPPPMPRPGARKVAAVVSNAIQAEERLAYEQPPVSQLPAAVARRAGPAMNAAALRRWLTPKVMRQQYILTEMFDPPPCSRQEDPAR